MALKVALELDVLGDTHPLWADWLDDAARRFRSIAELDVDALPEDRGRAAEELDRWADRGVGDWRGALERFAEDRPDAEISARLRELQSAGATLGVFTDAPEPLARVALSQLGAARRVDFIEAGAGALERLLERLGPDAVVVSSRDGLGRLAG